LIAIPLSLLGLEALVRLGVAIAGKTSELASYAGEPLLFTDYRFKQLNQSAQPFQGLSTAGRLAIQPHPLTGYQFLGNQRNAALQINAQGFRSEQPISVTKPKDEFRILVIGGSTAFGQLSSSNQATFAQQLENRLNQQVQAQKANPQGFRPDVLPYFADELTKVLKLPAKVRDSRYRVINAAVPGYTSGNSVSQFLWRDSLYQPNLVVWVNGYSDLLLPSTQVAAAMTAPDQLASNALAHLMASIGQGIKGVCNWFYLVKALQYWVLKPHPPLEQAIDPLNSSPAKLVDRLSADPQELNYRVARYAQNVQQMARMTNSAKVPLLLALSPEISRRPQPTPAEQNLLQTLGPDYRQRIQAGYQQLQQALETVKQTGATIRLVDLQPTTNQLQGEAFQDPIHLSDAANQAISDRLYDAIAPLLQVQPQPFQGAPPR
jgi:lysophospholipase L1-like esterase